MDIEHMSLDWLFSQILHPYFGYVILCLWFSLSNNCRITYLGLRKSYLEDYNSSKSIIIYLSTVYLGLDFDARFIQIEKNTTNITC